MKLCKDCSHFHIDYEPIKGVDFGRASCRKYNLITDFLDHRKFKRLYCVEEECADMRGDQDEGNGI